MALYKSTLISRGLRHASPIISTAFSHPSQGSAFAPASSIIHQGQQSECGRRVTRVYFFSTSATGNMKARKFVLAQRFQGAPKLSDFTIAEETLPPLQDGEILCKAEWLTVDPYMRPAADRLKIGDALPGGQVARVIQSRSADFPEGSQVVGNFGWADLTKVKVPPPEQRGIQTFHAMPDMKGLPDSYALGCMGMPGNTAYFGLTKIAEPKAGETLVVSAAAGAVGSLVGQIGKILGLKVIGYAGTEDKVQWLKTLGFDHAYNYKTQKLPETLKESATNGVDCYFDNVGGEFAYHVIRKMNPFGRISLCGAISIYNEDATKPVAVPFDYKALIYNNIKMEGFVVYRFARDWMKGINQMRDWILEDKLKIEETKYSGFEKMPQAFIDLLNGKNTGKVVIKA